ncbi:MAG: CinA family protein [Candidatus Nanohaloarchaea archaeon]
MDKQNIEAEVAEKLTERNETVATAESATGGLVGSMLTNVPGASEYYDSSLVVYSDRSKQQLLAVSSEALENGAVSKEVAKEMEQGVRDTSQTDWGVSTTGYAGPTGGNSEPIGTVYIGVAFSGNSSRDPFAVAEKHQFEGSREERKQEFARQALKALLKQISSNA